MRRLARTYSDWLDRWPSRGGDEFYRHTLVLPSPWPHRVDEDGDSLHRALVIVTHPWWLCRDALDPNYRQRVRWERGLNVALEVVPFDDDAAWDIVFDRYLATAGPRPAAP